MTRVNSSGRIQPIEYRNLAVPGECLMCKRIGRTPEEIFANFQVELEYYGLVYLCQDCCYEVSSFMEAVPKNEVAVFLLAINDLKTQLAELRNENMYLRRLLDVRIESAGRGESDLDGSASLPVLENDGTTADADEVSDGDKSELAESGADH